MDENNEIKELQLYIEQLEAENSRLKNSMNCQFWSYMQF